jgi:hypothetical protein
MLEKYSRRYSPASIATEDYAMTRKRQTSIPTPETTDNDQIGQRFHQTRCGLRGANVLLSWENPAEFEDFQSMIIQDLDPWGPLEYKLASRVADCLWQLDRIADYATWIAEVSSFRDEMLSDLLSLNQYEGHIEQSLQRALQELRHLRQGRNSEQRTSMPDDYFLVLHHDNIAADDAETDLSGPRYRPLPRTSTLRSKAIRSFAQDFTEDPQNLEEEPMYELTPAKLAELADIVLELQALPDRVDQLPAFQRTESFS